MIDKLWSNYLSKKSLEERDTLIVHYLHLVKFVVGRLSANYPSHVKLDDLYSSGVRGLINAVEKFDPSRKSKFESYAILRIKGSIIDELRAVDWIPRSVHQKANLIAKAQATLQERLGREATDEELSIHLGMSEEELGNLLERIRPAILIPLDREISQDDEDHESLAERIADTRAESSYDVAEQKERAELLAAAIDSLPKQQKKVLQLYYYEGMMLKEIGKVIGVSESRISQIHTQALLKLRFQLKDREEEYRSFD